MKGFWVWMLLFFKLNCTLPLDLDKKSSTDRGLQEENPDASRSYKTFHRVKSKVDDANFMDFKKVTEEIKEAVSRLEQLRNSEKYLAAEELEKGKVYDSPLTENVEDENIPQRAYHPVHQQGSLHDLKDYEKLVISKKYPYAEFDDLKSKQTLLNSHVGENSRASSPYTLAEQSICESPDEGLNIEIISRGLTGFEIPVLKQKADIEPIPDRNPEINHPAKVTEAVRAKKKQQDESFVDRLKQLIKEFEAKKKRRINASTLIE